MPSLEERFKKFDSMEQRFDKFADEESFFDKAGKFAKSVGLKALEANPYLKSLSKATGFTKKQFDKAIAEQEEIRRTGGVTRDEEGFITGEKGLKRPLVDPIDIISGGAFGAMIGRKAGLTGAKLVKEIARESVGELTLGASDVAEITGKQIAKTISRKKFRSSLFKTLDTADNDVKQVIDQFAKDEQAFKELKKFKLSNLKEGLARNVVDNTYNVRSALEKESRELARQLTKGSVPTEQITNVNELQKALDNAVMKRSTIRGSSSKTAELVDSVDKKVFGDMSPDEIQDLNRIREARRSIEVGEEKLRPGALTPDQHQKVLGLMEQNNPKQYQRLIAKADQLQEIYKDQLRQSMDAGLVSKQDFDNMLAKGAHYNPSRYIQHIDPAFEKISRGSKVTVSSSGLKYMDKGSTQALEKDSRALLQEYVARTQSAIDRNRANKALYDLAGFDNTIIKRYKDKRIFPITGKIEEGATVRVTDRGNIGKIQSINENEVEILFRNKLEGTEAIVTKRLDEVEPLSYDKAIRGNVFTKNGQKFISIRKRPPTGYDAIDVMIDGKRESMIMRQDLAAEWKGIDPVLSAHAAKALSVVTGSRLLKSFATGINPAFALRNFARDAAFIYMSPEYKSFLPVAAGQMANNYRRTFLDAVRKKGSYLEYIKEGGGMKTLTQQSRLFEKHFQKAQDVLGALGDFSERWTRLAHRDRAIMNGKTKEMATFIARDALDFNAGGTVAKALDSGVPYLNAGIQGTRGIFKFARKDPKKFAFKLGNLAAVSTGLYLYNTYNYKEDFDKIDPRDKATNWVIMTPLTYKDRNDETQRWHISIPKDQSQRVLTALFDNTISKVWNDETNLKQLQLAGEDFWSLFPGGESYLPPAMKASIGYATNYDFWKDREIWRGEEGIDPELESTPYTSEMYKTIGEFTGLSPERLKYANRQFFTSSNTFTNTLGMGLDQIMKSMNQDEQVMASEDIIRSIPGVRTFLRGVYEDSKYIEENQRIKQEVKSEKVRLKRSQDQLLKQIDKGRPISLMQRWVKKQDPLKQPYLENRFNQYMELKDVDKANWKWWMDVSYETDPKAQAIMFNEKYKNMDSAGKKNLIYKLNRLDSTRQFSFGEQFWAEFQKIRGNL